MSDGYITESESKQMIEWCYENGLIPVSCPQTGNYVAFMVEEMGYDESCVWKHTQAYLMTGLDFVATMCD